MSNVYVADRENQRVQVFDSSGNFQGQWNDLAMASCITVDVANRLAYVGEFYAGIPQNPLGWGNWTGKRLGPRVTVFDLDGNVIARVGDEPQGEGPGQFITPHGIAVDTHGDIYVAEVSYAAYGSRLDPPTRGQVDAKAGPAGVGSVRADDLGGRLKSRLVRSW